MWLRFDYFLKTKHAYILFLVRSFTHTAQNVRDLSGAGADGVKITESSAVLQRLNSERKGTQHFQASKVTD